MATIYDIAKKTGYSTATVSSALGGYKDVKASTKQMIIDAAKEIGYQPNLIARSLTKKKSWNLGILFLDKDNSGLKHRFFASVIESIIKTSAKRGYDITLISSYLGKKEVTYLEHSMHSMFDGVIIACIDFGKKEVVELINSSIPVAMIDQINNNAICVNSKNEDGIHLLVNHLYEKGYRKIYYIHGQKGNFVSDERIIAFEKIVNKLGITELCHLYEGHFSDAKSSYDLTKKIMESNDLPDAIMYRDDVAATGGLKYLIKHNYKIPQDVAICGYDGLDLANLLTPSLTTIRQDSSMIGALCSNILIDKIDKIRDDDKTVEVDVSLIKGEST